MKFRIDRVSERSDGSMEVYGEATLDNGKPYQIGHLVNIRYGPFETREDLESALEKIIKSELKAIKVKNRKDLVDKNV